MKNCKTSTLFNQMKEKIMLSFMVNPNLLDPDFEESNSVSNAPVVSTIIDNLSLPNEQFYEICSQLNEGQQHLFNFIMQYALRCKLAEKNNELPPKPFQIFFSAF